LSGLLRVARNSASRCKGCRPDTTPRHAGGRRLGRIKPGQIPVGTGARLGHNRGINRLPGASRATENLKSGVSVAGPSPTIDPKEPATIAFNANGRV
jgi:hypothetical protein